jgi:hypothetical protein
MPDQLGDHGEGVLRPECAVGAQRHDRQVGQRDRHFARGLAAERAAVGGERGLGDDRCTGQFRGGGDRFGEFVEIPEGFQDEHVHAALGERADLLADRGYPLGGGEERALARGHRGGHGAGHEDLAPGLVLRLARDPHPGEVDLAHRPGRPVLGQPQRAGAERVGLDDVHARRQVTLVHRADQFGVAEVQLGQRPVERVPGGVQHGAHGAVAHQHAFAQCGDEPGHGASPTASRISSATWAISRSR